MPVSRLTRLIVVVLMLVTSAATYVLGHGLPSGVASGVPYVAVVLLSTLLKTSHAPRWTAVGCTLLVALGYFTADESPQLIYVLNRLYALFVIWVTALITSHRLVDEQRLHEIATIDELTGLLNRRHLMATLEIEVGRARRHGHALTVCMCDLDGFKRVNDTHGHLVGDRILTGFARLLRRTVRESDVVGRYGGDEFCLAFPHADQDEVAGVLRRLLPRVPGVMHEALGHENEAVTATFGVAMLAPEHESVHALIETADQALYRGKESGRNCILTATSASTPTRVSPRA